VTVTTAVDEAIWAWALVPAVGGEAETVVA